MQAFKQKEEKRLTEGQCIGLNDQPVIFSLIRGEGGDPVLRLFPRPALLLQLLPQHLAVVGVLLQGFIQFDLSSGLGVLELLRVPEFSLHKLILQLSGDFLLSVQGLAVLDGELLLFSCDPEKETVNRKKPVGSREARQTKNNMVPLSAES